MKTYLASGRIFVFIKGICRHRSKLRFTLIFLSTFFCSFIFAQRAITGRVTAGDTALANVTVQVKGTRTSAQTDADGNFTITAPSNATLVFSSVGYGSVEEKLAGRSSLLVQLQSSSQQLQDVVVVGYGTQRRRDITGAVSTVKAGDLNQTNAVSIDNLLQGRAAGLNVATNTAQPGGAVNINIRGAISPRGDNSPLYVIDGLPITTNASTEFNSVTGNFRGGFSRSPLDNINPNDIESVDILKDASATAIYGSAAANGVILITTKRGKEGRASVSYSGTYSIQTPKKYLETLNAVEFRNSVNTYGLEFFKFNNRLAPYGNGTTPLASYKPYFTDAQIAETNLGMNYIDYVVRQGRVNDHNISLSSGNANTKVFTSFNYLNQQGLLRNSDFSRYSARVNLDQRLSAVVSFNLGLSYSQVNSNNVPTGQSGDIDSPSLLQSALQFAPDIPPFDSTGKPNPSYYARTPNPASFFQILNKNFSRRFVATPNLQINISKGLKVNVTGGIDNTNTDRQFFIPVRANFSTVPQGNAQMGLTKLNNYSAEAYASYDKAFANSRFSGVAGVGYYSSVFSDFGLNAVGFSTDVFGVNNIGIAYNRAQSSQSSNRTARNKLSQFTRLNYTLMDKYIVQFTGRFDGTSNFPQNNLFGFFPGVSAGWVMSEENFLNDSRWLNQLKLRAGYGTSGNESITTSGNYVYSLYSLSTAYNYLIGNQLYNSGFLQTQLGNTDLKWETDVTFNVGVDFSLFNNRLSGSIDYFRRTAKDLLDFRVLPASNPITSQAFNVGSTRSTGIELTLRSQNFESQNFTWTTLLTLGTSKSYWVERNPAVTLPQYIGYNDPIRAVYGWKTDGIIRSTSEIPKHQGNAFVGNVKYQDINGDGKLDINDVTYLGNNDPKATFGLNNTIRFKTIDLSFFVYGAYGNFTNDGYATFVQLFRLTRPGVPSNVERHTLDAYTSFTPGGTYPGFANDPAAANNPTQVNDFRTVQNSFFARLRNVNLGYSLPPIGKQKFVRSLRVFVDFNNLFFVTNVRGLDPEMERNNNPYPTALTTAFGITAQF